MQIQVTLLGPVEVQTSATTVRLTGQRARLVAALALIGRPSVGPAALIEWMWDDPPPTARQQLHKLVAGVRVLVPGMVVTESAGYRLAERVSTDIAEFRRLAAGDDVASWTAALALWRGRLWPTSTASARPRRPRPGRTVGSRWWNVLPPIASRTEPQVR